MKQLYFSLVALFFAIANLNAQGIFQNEIETEGSTITANYQSFKSDVPYRIGNGIASITPFFEGGLWDSNSKAAVDYACRLMAEYISTTYPIRIKIIRDVDEYVSFVKTFVSSSNIYSRPTFDFANSKSFVIPYATSKRAGVLGFATDNFYDSNNGLYNAYDAEIYLSPDDIFSCTLDCNVETGKYDLVTVILRELAKGLAMNPGVKTIAGQSNALNIYLEQSGVNYITPYTYMMSFPSYPTEAYDFFIDKHDVYSPSVFDRNKSLLYFKKDPNNIETILLQPDLPKETAIHNIGSAFRDVLKSSFWIKLNTIVGGDAGPVSLLIPDTNVKPKDATVTFSNYNLNASRNGLRMTTQADILSNLKVDTFYHSSGRTKTKSLRYIGEPTFNGVNGYFHYQNDGIIGDLLYGNNYDNTLGWSLFLLNKDGSLTQVAQQPNTSLPFVVDLSQIPINNNYDRTSDGFLRARLNFNYYPISGEYYYDGANPSTPIRRYNYAQYLCINYTPKESNLEVKRNFIRSAPVDPNSYYREINLVFDNMEGVTSARLIQKEYDESGLLTTTSYIVNPNSGEYIAEVDNELRTTFQLSSTNSSGTVLSQIVNVEPLLVNKAIILEMTVTLKNENNLELQFKDANGMLVNNPVSFSKITNISQTNISKEGKIINNSIDISNLPKGVYIITAKDKSSNTYNAKFIK